MFSRKIIIGLFCLGAIALGSTAGSFLDNPISARSMALGNASAALNEGSAAFRNPAAVKLQPGQRYQIMQGQVLEEASYFAFNYSLNKSPFMDLGLGFSFLNSGVEGLRETVYDQDTGTAAYTGNAFSYAGRAFVFTTGLEALNDFFLGANFKVIQENLHEQSSIGLGLDIGMIWQTNDKLTLGLSFINAVPPKLTWSNGWEEPLDTKILFGLAYNMLQNWAVYTDIEYSTEKPLYFGLGTEYTLFNAVALRGGWTPDQISLGTGLNWNNFSIDYAYLLNSDQDLGSTHFISIAYLIDANEKLANLARDEHNRRRLQDAIEAERQRQELEALNRIISGNTIIEEIVTASAEIAPLPILEQTIMETVTIDTAAADSAILDPVEQIMTTVITTTLVTTNAEGEQEVLQTIIEEEVLVNIIEESAEDILDYSIALMSARYFYEANRLQGNTYLDNTGNKPIEVTSTFRLLDSNNKVLTESTAISKIGVKDTEVLRIFYDEEMPVGTYYLELNSHSSEISKYQKEQFIKRN